MTTYAWTADQRRNAATIISVGRSLGASTRDILIALMAALVESGLRSGLTEARSDADSAGLFQQRRAWAPGGSEAYRLNPVNAARMFFLGGVQGQRGLLDFSASVRNATSLGAMAQRVQVSAFPTRYATQEARARSLLGLGGGAASSSSGGFIRPVPSPMGRPWGYRWSGYAAGYHTGQDFRAPMGTAVRASAAGTVIRASSGGAYGQRIEISHGGQLWTLYAHLSRMMVRPGQRVAQGQVIGLSGNSGSLTSGPHLHFEIRKGSNSYGANVNPVPYFGSGTVNGYLDKGTTVVSPDMAELDPMQALQEQVAMSKPYVWLDPTAMWAQPQIPIGEDPLALFGEVAPMPPPGKRSDLTGPSADLDRPSTDLSQEVI